MACTFAEEASDTISRLCPATRHTNKDDNLEIGRVLEVCKESMLEAARGLVAQSSGGALLTTKSADGTPLRIGSHPAANLPSSAPPIGDIRAASFC